MDLIDGKLALEQLSKSLSTLYFDLLGCHSPRMEHLWEKWKTDQIWTERTGMTVLEEVPRH